MQLISISSRDSPLTYIKVTFGLKHKMRHKKKVRDMKFHSTVRWHTFRNLCVHGVLNTSLLVKLITTRAEGVKAGDTACEMMTRYIVRDR